MSLVPRKDGSLFRELVATVLHGSPPVGCNLPSCCCASCPSSEPRSSLVSRLGLLRPNGWGPVLRLYLRRRTSFAVGQIRSGMRTFVAGLVNSSTSRSHLTTHYSVRPPSDMGDTRLDNGHWNLARRHHDSGERNRPHLVGCGGGIRAGISPGLD